MVIDDVTPSSFKIGPLEETEKFLGVEHTSEGVDEVTRSDIRRKLEVFAFDCPLYYDADAAKAHGYKDIIAPSTMISLWSMGAYWQPGDPAPYPGEPTKHGTLHLMEIPAPYGEAINAGSEWEYLEPIYPGDRLNGVWKLIEIKPRRTRLGEGVFLTVEAVYRKQTGEIVGIEKNTLFRYKEDAERVDEVRASAEKEAVRTSPSVPPNTSVDWARQRYFEDVKEGDELAPHSIPVTYQRVVMGIAADRMFSPVHHNRDYSRTVGLDDIIYNTRSYEMLFEIGARRWIGLDGVFRRLGPFRMIQNTHPGDIITCYGKVAGKEIRDGKGYVHLEMWDETQRRGVVARAEVDVILPQRGR